MAMREMTQFSMVEFNAFVAEAREAKTTREMYMVAFQKDLKPDTFATIGGTDNVQRVRVIGNGMAIDRFEFTTKLPPHLVAQRKREQERKEREKAILTKMEALRSDPKAFEQYVRTAVKAILGAAALDLLRASKNAKASRPKPAAKPRRKMDSFEAALAQDRRNRIEAAKQAAAAYHSKKDKAA